jgi:hypothetical protein
MCFDLRPGEPNTLALHMMQQLDAIILSAQFASSPVMAKLLNYLVQQTLAGNGAKLKSYSVAVDCLGRDPDFEPSIDSYPRVQVGRLRKMLEAYYARQPQHGDNCLSIPNGSYEVRLLPRSQAYPLLGHSMSTDDVKPQAAIAADLGPPPKPISKQRSMWTNGKLRCASVVLAMSLAVAAVLLLRLPQQAQAQAPAPDVPTIAVEVSDSRSNVATTTSKVIDSQLVEGISRFPTIKVLDTSRGDADYNLEAIIRPRGVGGERLHLKLYDNEEHSLIWGGVFPIFALDDETNYAIGPAITKIAGLFGVVAQHERNKLQGNTTTGFACILAFHQYFRTRDQSLRASVDQCVQKNSPEPELQPAILTARALMIYDGAVDPKDRSAALATASRLVEDASSIESLDAHAYFGRAMTAFYAGRCELGLESAKAMANANPYSAELRRLTGLVMLPCDKEAARKMLAEAQRLEFDGPLLVRLPTIMVAIKTKNRAALAQALDGSDLPTDTNRGYQSLLRTLAYANIGNNAKARASYEIFKKATPGKRREMDDLVRIYILSDQLRSDVVADLRAAGLR